MEYNTSFKVRKNGKVVQKIYKVPIFVDDCKKENDSDGFYQSLVLESKISSSNLISDDVQIANAIVDYDRLLKRLEDSKVKIEVSDKLCVRNDNLSRSRNMIIDYACEYEKEWKSFLTLTFKENIKDIDYANKIFHKFMVQFKRRCKKQDLNLMYICVPEFQKRGAVHYHLLTNIPLDSDLLPRQEHDKYKNFYNVRYWNHGFSSAFDIKNDTDDTFNIALYVVKYLFKDLDQRLFGHRRVLTSHNLKKPNVYKLEKESDTYNYAMDYVKKFDVSRVYEHKVEDIYSFQREYVEIEYDVPLDEIDIIKGLLDDSLQF